MEPTTSIVSVTEEDARRMLRALDGAVRPSALSGKSATISATHIYCDTEQGYARGPIVVDSTSVHALDRFAAEVFGPHLCAALEEYRERLRSVVPS